MTENSTHLEIWMHIKLQQKQAKEILKIHTQLFVISYTTYLHHVSSGETETTTSTGNVMLM